MNAWIPVLIVNILIFMFHNKDEIKNPQKWIIHKSEIYGRKKVTKSLVKLLLSKSM
jgi:hypothetical protein